MMGVLIPSSDEESCYNGDWGRLDRITCVAPFSYTYVLFLLGLTKVPILLTFSYYINGLGISRHDLSPTSKSVVPCLPVRP